jgi:large subunit ribosomal protein L18
VFRSDKHIYAQIIDDVQGHTLAAASTVEADVKKGLEVTNNVDAAKAVGELVARRALDKGIKEIIFDRGGYVYHGKVKALADAAREAGLQF